MNFEEMGVVVQIFSIIVLVLVNIILLRHNQRVLSEMERTRKAGFLPIFKSSLHFLGPVNVCLRLENAGRGPMSSVKIKITIVKKEGSEQENDVEINWNKSVITPGEFYDFFLPKDKCGFVHDLCNNFSHIIIEGCFVDIFDRPKPINESISIDEIAQYEGGGLIMYREENEDYKKKMDELIHTMKDIKRAVDGLKTKTSK